MKTLGSTNHLIQKELRKQKILLQLWRWHRTNKQNEILLGDRRMSHNHSVKAILRSLPIHSKTRI